MSELKPCPFCGSPAYSYHDNCIDFAGVKCDLGGCVCADILITENNWNTRPIEDALNARIAELEAAQRWIPVSEPPKVSGKYLLLNIYYDVYPCDFTAGTEIWVLPDSDTVTHWMPLPKLPEVQE